MAPVLQLEQVSGGYIPGRPFLRELSFAVSSGEMVGLIGLNGAGKSTTIKHILGLLEPEGGRIEVLGHTLKEAPETYRSSIAYVPETPVLYDELTVREHLKLTAMAYELSQDEYARREQELGEQFRMTDKMQAFPIHLSKGMRQKVMVMNAFLAAPPLYVIDEPFLGLDPLGIRSLLDRMVEWKRKGSALLISSHILSTIEQYCDRFLVLHHGRLIASGTLSDLAEQAQLPQDSRLDELFFALVGGEGE